jgi:exodeoxyribonuclease VII small subunit
MTNSDSREQPTPRRRKGATTQAAAGVNGAHANKHADAAQADPQADPQADDEQPFEASLAQLDQIVATLEDGRLPLDDALALFERGVRLARRCQAQLDNAELRVERLRAESGMGDLGAADAAYSLEDFDEADE